MVLGNFDGVHKGHQALLREAVRLGKAFGLPVAVWSFGILSGACLTAPSVRAEWLYHYGVDHVIYDDFERVRQFSPERFFQEILLDSLQAKGCICGFNYSFGQGGQGTADTLSALCREAGILCQILPEVILDGESVSSTRIRSLLREGQIEAATHLLGHPFLVKAAVQNGRHFGRTIGIPTLNQSFDSAICLPRRGVYATYCRVDGRVYPSVTNIGCCPTVTEGTETVVETHILDFDGEIYGKTAEIGFLRWLREEKKFSSVEILKEEIQKNCHEARVIFSKNAASGLFDLLAYPRTPRQEGT